MESRLSLDDETHVVENLWLVVFLYCDFPYDKLVELHAKHAEFIRLNYLGEDLAASDVDF